MLKKIFITLLASSILLFNASFYTLYDFEQALVIRFGSIQKFEKTPGLHFKYPFIDKISIFNKKILNSNLIEKEMICADQKKYIISSIIKYKIDDIKLFYETLFSYENANQTILNISESAVRDKIGKIVLNDLLSSTRSGIINDIKQKISAEAKNYGLMIYDFRINRTDLPDENAQAVFDRMISERKKEIALIQTEGERIQTIIMSEADLAYEKLITEGKIEASIIRAKAIEYQNEKYKELLTISNNDKRLFNLYTNLKSLEKILKKSENITLSAKCKLLEHVFEK